MCESEAAATDVFVLCGESEATATDVFFCAKAK